MERCSIPDTTRLQSKRCTSHYPILRNFLRSNREKNMATILIQDTTCKLRATGEIVAMETGRKGQKWMDLHSRLGCG